jgi:hypothetical protein
MTFDRRRSELEARSLRRLDLPRVYHENQIAELDAHNYFLPQTGRLPQYTKHRPQSITVRPQSASACPIFPDGSAMEKPSSPLETGLSPTDRRTPPIFLRLSPLHRWFSPISRPRFPIFLPPPSFTMACSKAIYENFKLQTVKSTTKN